MTWKKIFILIFIAAIIGLAAAFVKSVNSIGAGSQAAGLSDSAVNLSDNSANAVEKKSEVNLDNYLENQSSRPPAGSANNPVKPAPAANIQNIKAVYTGQDGIMPSDFKVKAGWPVRFFVRAEDDGLGCMSTIMVAELYEEPQFLEAGKTIVMEFTPRRKGDYDIICAMGIPWGIIKVE